MYQIFDSMDRPDGAPAARERDLYDQLDTLNREAEEDNTGYTFAIGKILEDGSVTFDF